MEVCKSKKIKIWILAAIAFGISALLLKLIQVREVEAAKGNELVVEILGTDIKGKMIEGDCFIISYGDVEILVDCASKRDATFEQIQKCMSNAMIGDDGKVWDYVIFTHPDEDHIGNFENVLNQFGDEMKLGTIIDFDIIPNEGESLKYTPTANNYRKNRDDLIKKGVSYFSASELKPTSLTRTFDISPSNGGGVPCSLTVLYNYYGDPDHITYDSKGEIADTNLISVCFVIKLGDQKLLFTGDLTKSGEEKLMSYHKGDILKNVTYFKASHHGSQGGNRTEESNSEKFVDWIRPQFVSITAKHGAALSDVSISNFLKYTDFILPTYVYWENDYYLMYGTQEITFDGTNAKVDKIRGEEIYGDIVPLKAAVINTKDGEKQWYDSCLELYDRKIKDALFVYTFDDVIDGEVEGKAEYYNCTLIKYGSYDLLIDCGSSSEVSDAFVRKLKQYVVDGIIECIIVTHNKPYCISQIAGNYTLNDEGGKTIYKKGLVDTFKVDMVIDSAYTNLDEKNTSSCFFRYKNIIKSVPKYISLKGGEQRELELPNGGPTVTIYGSTFTKNEDENNYSLTTIIEFYGEKMLFVGDLANYSNLMRRYSKVIENVSFLRLSNSDVAIKDMKEFRTFASTTNPEFVVMGTPMYYPIQGLGKEMFDDDDQTELLDIFKNGNIYYLGYDFVAPGEHFYRRVNGDLVYRISYNAREKLTNGIFKIDSDKNEWGTAATLDTFDEGKKIVESR